MFLIVLSVQIQFLNAQSDTLKHPEQFLFPKFVEGTLKMKEGTVMNQTLNFNILSGKLVYIKNGEILGLSNSSVVDTVYTGQRKFVPVEKQFYELLVSAPFVLFIQYSGSATIPPRRDSYGAISEAASVSTYKSMKVGDQFYTIDDQEIVIKKVNIYWLRINGNYQDFRDANQLIKIYPDFKIEIKDFIKKNKIKFSESTDVVKLIYYCNTFLKK